MPAKFSCFSRCSSSSPAQSYGFSAAPASTACPATSRTTRGTCACTYQLCHAWSYHCCCQHCSGYGSGLSEDNAASNSQLNVPRAAVRSVREPTTRLSRIGRLVRLSCRPCILNGSAPHSDVYRRLPRQPHISRPLPPVRFPKIRMQTNPPNSVDVPAAADPAPASASALQYQSMDASPVAVELAPPLAPRLWKVGTLTYTTGGLVLVMLWLLISDAGGLSLRDRSEERRV